jgi:hypothetical protein
MDDPGRAPCRHQHRRAGSGACRSAVGAAYLQNHNPNKISAPAGRHIQKLSLLNGAFESFHRVSTNMPALRASLKPFAWLACFTVSVTHRNPAIFTA